MPTMEPGDILGHEPMGIVVEVGSAVRKVKKGDRVVVPFTIACGECHFCIRQLFSCCDRSNPNAELARKAMGHSPSGLFGYSHMLGGFPGPFGAFMNKGLTMKTGQTHMQRYMKPLLAKIEAGEIDPSFVITHKVKLEEAPEMYRTFRDKKDGCIKVVLQPGA